MYQINIRDAKKRARGVISSLTWKRRGGCAIVKKFYVTDHKHASIRFDQKEEAQMVAKSLKSDFGLDTTVSPAVLR